VGIGENKVRFLFGPRFTVYFFSGENPVKRVLIIRIISIFFVRPKLKLVLNSFYAKC
jgi:hypothetical protein